MDTNTFHFNIGKFDCVALSDGSVSGEDAAQILFANAPQRTLEQALREYNFPSGQWTEIFNCLLIKTGKHCVLVDTGLGCNAGEPDTGKLLQNLQGEGIEPGDIDTVIISHAHGDHIGGNTDPSGQAAFPHATYYIWKEEWDFWTSKQTLEQPAHQWMIEFVNKNMLPIHHKFNFLTQDLEIVPGVKSFFAPGHTPGNLALIIESSHEKLFYLGDMLLHPIHLEHPDWYSSVDCLPSEVEKTRRRLLMLASAENAPIFLYHFDFPGLGFALPQKETWKWQAYVAK